MDNRTIHTWNYGCQNSEFLRYHNEKEWKIIQTKPHTCGACIVIPAVVVSNTCSYWPANRDTSVDVPEEKKLYSYSPVHSCTKILNYGITLLW